MRLLLRFAPALLVLLCAAGAVRAAELRLGIIGLDTSHVAALLDIYNNPKSPDYVPGARVVAAFRGGSPDVEASRTRVDGYTRLAVNRYHVKLYDSIAALAREVDAILILSVDGRVHLDQFRRTLAAKKPVFIDKPFAGSLHDAVEIAWLAQAAHVPCFSSSSVRYMLDSPVPRLGTIAPVVSAYAFSPGELEPHHPDLYWYGVHAVEALYAVLGPGCVRVTRVHTADTDVVTGVWADGRIGIVQANRRRTQPKYGIAVLGAKGLLVGGEKHSYKPLAEKTLTFFRTGIAPVPLSTTVEMYAFMEAADESKRRGGSPVTLAEVLRAEAPAAAAGR